MIYFVYVLQNSKTGMLYIGFTANLKHRVSEHKEGKSLFTRKNRKEGKWKLIYFEGYPNKKDAESREKFLKGGSGRNYLKKQLHNYFNNFNQPV
jgi:putative endonuclease